MTREGSPGRGQDRKLQSGVPPATAVPPELLACAEGSPQGSLLSSSACLAAPA